MSFPAAGLPALRENVLSPITLSADKMIQRTKWIEEQQLAICFQEMHADMAQSCRLRPGERAVMQGTLQQQTIPLENGATTSIEKSFPLLLLILTKCYHLLQNSCSWLTLYL
jgi:hypothetical protein